MLKNNNTIEIYEADATIMQSNVANEKGVGETIKAPSMKDSLSLFWTEEDGMGVVEVILIIVVLISLVLIFKKQITSLVTTIMSTITKNAKSVYK